MGDDRHGGAEAGPVERLDDDGGGGAVVERLADLVRRHGLVAGPVHGHDAVAVLPVGEPVVDVGGSGHQVGAQVPEHDPDRVRQPPVAVHEVAGHVGARGSAPTSGRAGRSASPGGATSTSTGGSGGWVSTTTGRVTRALLPCVSSASSASTYGPSASASHSPSRPAATGTDDRCRSVQDKGAAPAPTNRRYSAKSSTL